MVGPLLEVELIVEVLLVTGVVDVEEVVELVEEEV